MFKNGYTLPTLNFLSFALEVYQNYEKLFQKNEPTIHLLYDQQVDLFRNTLLMYCKFTSVAALIKDKDLVNFKFSDKENHMPVKSICIGEKTKSYIRKFSENEYTIFMAGIKKYYIKMSECLLKNLSLKKTVFWQIFVFLILHQGKSKMKNKS